MPGLVFLGCGFATRLHSRTLRRADVRRFYASRSSERAAEYDRKYGGAGHFGSYDAAIEAPEVDIVFVATPPASHLDLALQALDAGKHVIVEKPPVPSVAELDRLAEAAERAGKRVLVAENYFYKPLLRYLREAIADGAIGTPRIISINALKEQQTSDWRDRPGQALGGAMFEGGIHWVSFMANLGLTVRDVHGHYPNTDGGPDRTMVSVFDYEEGAVGTLAYSWEIGSPTRGLRLSAIHGTEGAITFESNGLIVGVRGRRKRLAMPHPRDLLGYGAMFDDFLGAIASGRAAAYDLDRARRDLELVERIYQTAGLSAPGSSGDGE